MRSAYRIWPAVLIAVAGLIGAAVLIGSGPADAGTGRCGGGATWVAVSQLSPDVDHGQVLLADYPKRLLPVLSGCLDLNQVAPADPRS